MSRLFDSTVSATITFLIYRYRFLVAYIGFGVLSLWVEIFLMRGLEQLGSPSLPARLSGLAAGVGFAFWTNARFNFKVPVSKRNRALLYFVVIAIASATINLAFQSQLLALGWTYETARFLVSGLLFSAAYVLHRRYSFADRKQVGVAVYANGVEDIRAIRAKISDFPDFIHVDLIDHTYRNEAPDVRSYRLEAIRAYWPRQPIHVHLMTRHPTRWLPEILPYADLVIVHYEIDEPLDIVFARIKAGNCQAGLALQLSTPAVAALPQLDRLQLLMLLTIAQPGNSGQHFEHESALAKIDEVNRWPQRRGFSLCVDGGVNEKNIHFLNVELVVSGSSVLGAAHPARQIMRLQTSSNYEAT